MNMLAPHPDCALEYWYFKVNSGPVALLVDWIARRKQGTNVLRVSIHAPQQRVVLFDTLPAPMIAERNFISLERTVGQLGELSWAFDIDCGPERIEPDIFPVGLLKMRDLSQVSAPRARFTGWVRQGSLQADFEAAPGLIAHYWGRQLAQEWWWISANQFDRGDLAVDCALISTALWGLPIQVPLAYLYLSRGTERKLLLSPPAIARATGTPEAFEIQFQGLGARPITLRARGRQYGSLGDGIVNTLVGDLEVLEGETTIGRAEGTAALERRVPQARTM